MTKLLKVCFALTFFIVFYFIGYAGTGFMHAHFSQPDPLKQVASIEELAEAFGHQRFDTAQLETCEQEAE